MHWMKQKLDRMTTRYTVSHNTKPETSIIKSICRLMFH